MNNKAEIETNLNRRDTETNLPSQSQGVDCINTAKYSMFVGKSFDGLRSAVLRYVGESRAMLVCRQCGQAPVPAKLRGSKLLFGQQLQ